MIGPPSRHSVDGWKCATRISAFVGSWRRPRGTARRVAEAQDFVDQIVAAGGSAQLLNASPYTHEQINSELGAPDETVVTPTVTAFVERCLA